MHETFFMKSRMGGGYDGATNWQGLRAEIKDHYRYSVVLMMGRMSPSPQFFSDVHAIYLTCSEYEAYPLLYPDLGLPKTIPA